MYQQNLKERTAKLKEMVRDLKHYQSQVNAYKFEIERLDKEIANVKQYYFNHKDRMMQQEHDGMGAGDLGHGNNFDGNFGGMDPNQLNM